MISFAITTHNRFQMTIDCFAQIIDNDFISEFVIVDDDSKDSSGEKLYRNFYWNNKVKVFINGENIQMSRNKETAIALCKSDFVLIADSDNIFSNESINALRNIDFKEDTIYCPSFAKPTFDYRKFSNQVFDKNHIKELVNDSMGNCCMNTANYVVPRENYSKVYEYNPSHLASDTIWFNYLWLKAGNKFEIVEGFEYNHLQHSGSGFLKDLDYNMKKAEEVRKLILAL